MNRVPEAICWHEGMQLLPQHFQLQSLRAEGLAAYYAAAAQPYFWGVTRLELDHSALSTGKVRITALDAVLPDGLLVQHDVATGTALEFDCTALPPARQKGIIVLYLALPPSIGQANCRSSRIAMCRLIANRSSTWPVENSLAAFPSGVPALASWTSRGERILFACRFSACSVMKADSAKCLIHRPVLLLHQTRC